MIRTIDVGNDFSKILTNRDISQRDGSFTAIEFRNSFLKELDDDNQWKDDATFCVLDFRNVDRLGPSWANEVFAYFARYAKPERILRKITLANISSVKRAIIEKEIETGYY